MPFNSTFYDYIWTSHKIIINFKPIFRHEGDKIGRLLLIVLMIVRQNLLIITLNNAPLNDVVFVYIFIYYF